MTHRTQLHVDEAQYRWLKRRAARAGSIAAVVRDLIDTARRAEGAPANDPLLEYLLREPPGEGRAPSSVTTLDDDLYRR